MCNIKILLSFVFLFYFCSCIFHVIFKCWFLTQFISLFFCGFLAELFYCCFHFIILLFSFQCFVSVSIYMAVECEVRVKFHCCNTIYWIVHLFPTDISIPLGIRLGSNGMWAMMITSRPAHKTPHSQLPAFSLALLHGELHVKNDDILRRKKPISSIQHLEDNSKESHLICIRLVWERSESSLY